MKLLSYLTPWRTIATLKNRVSYLEGRLDEVADRAEDAEARAFDRAARYYQFQLERARDAEKAAMAGVMQAVSNMPIPPFMIQMVKDAPDADR